MSNRMGNRPEPVVVTSAGIIRDLEQFPASSGSLDSTALAFEHVLASLARLEARFDALERRRAIAQPPPRPDPDPPYYDGLRGRGDAWRHRPVVSEATTVASQPHVGFAATRVTQQRANSDWIAYVRYGYGGDGVRGRRPTAWDNPAHRFEDHPGQTATEWDQPRYDQPRYDHYRVEKPRYEKMRAPRFDGSDAANLRAIRVHVDENQKIGAVEIEEQFQPLTVGVAANVNFAATTKTDEAGGFVAAGVSAGGVVAGVPMVVGGDPPDKERSDPGGYKREQQIQPQVQSPMHQEQISQAQFQQKQSGGSDFASPDSVLSEGGRSSVPVIISSSSIAISLRQNDENEVPSTWDPCVLFNSSYSLLVAENNRDGEAAQIYFFEFISKVYIGIHDPISRGNYEKYCHSNCRQGFQVEIALPKFLLNIIDGVSGRILKVTREMASLTPDWHRGYKQALGDSSVHDRRTEFLSEVADFPPQVDDVEKAMEPIPSQTADVSCATEEEDDVVMVKAWVSTLKRKNQPFYMTSNAAAPSLREPDRRLGVFAEIESHLAIIDRRVDSLRPPDLPEPDPPNAPPVWQQPTS